MCNWQDADPQNAKNDEQPQPLEQCEQSGEKMNASRKRYRVATAGRPIITDRQTCRTRTITYHRRKRIDRVNS